MSRANEPAFPLTEDAVNHRNKDFPMQGLTKRELFAMAAMQGLLANLADIRREGFRDHEIAEFAVMRADALLAELQK